MASEERRPSIIPARCPRCGLIFPSRGIHIDPGVVVEHLEMGDNTEPCPRCGARARSMSGSFDLLEDGIRVLASSAPVDPEQLAMVLRSLRDLQKVENPTAEAVEAVLATAPEPVRRLGLALRPSKEDVYFWVALLVALLAWWASRQPIAVDSDSVDQIVREVVEQLQAETPDRRLGPPRVTHDPPPPAAPKAGAREREVPRNAPCPCGSGRRYKRCHGGPGYESEGTAADPVTPPE